MVCGKVNNKNAKTVNIYYNIVKLITKLILTRRA